MGQASEANVAKKAANLAATIASTTTKAAKATTTEALMLATKKQQEADIARQRADDALSIVAEKEAAMKLVASKLEEAKRTVQFAQDQVTQDEEAQKVTARDYFEAATAAGAGAKKATQAAEAVAAAQENIAPVGADPNTWTDSVQSLLDVGERNSDEIQELGL